MKIENYHRVNIVSGERQGVRNFAAVRYDPKGKTISASDGEIVLVAPCRKIDSPEFSVSSAKWGAATHAQNNLGLMFLDGVMEPDPLPAPEYHKELPVEEPTVTARVRIEHLKKIIKYAELAGASHALIGLRDGSFNQSEEVRVMLNTPGGIATGLMPSEPFSTPLQRDSVVVESMRQNMPPMVTRSETPALARQEYHKNSARTSHAWEARHLKQKEGASG